MGIFWLIVGLFLFVGLVVVHEFGHFIMARRNGVEVEEFGMEPMMLPPGSSYDSDTDDDSYVDGNGDMREGTDHLSLPSLRD